VVESGKMTRDLAMLIRADYPYLNTDAFLAEVQAELGKRLN
jgi:isocitrate dehydrogenase